MLFYSFTWGGVFQWAVTYLLRCWQAGNPSEREQRLITLTAQIAACRGREAERERQTRELQVLVDGQGAELAELERSLEVRHCCARPGTRLRLHNHTFPGGR